MSDDSLSRLGFGNFKLNVMSYLTQHRKDASGLASSTHRTLFFCLGTFERVCVCKYSPSPPHHVRLSSIGTSASLERPKNDRAMKLSDAPTSANVLAVVVVRRR
jgi:hypothetical protein